MQYKFAIKGKKKRTRDSALPAFCTHRALECKFDVPKVRTKDEGGTVGVMLGGSG